MKRTHLRGARFTLLALTVFTVAGLTVAFAQSPVGRYVEPTQGRFRIRATGPSPYEALPANQAIPVSNVVAFETEFTRQLNDQIRFLRAKKEKSETTIVHTRVYRDFIDTTLVRHAHSKATAIPAQQLQELRELIHRRLDQALVDPLAARSGLDSLGNGVLSRDFFTGRIRPASDRYVPPPTFDRPETMHRLEPRSPAPPRGWRPE